MKRRSFLYSVGSFAVLTPALTTPLAAGHKYCTRTRCCLPNRDYEHDLERFGASEIAPAIAGGVQDATWLENASVTENGVPRTIVQEKTVQQKRFYLRTAGITVEPILLNQIGLDLYSTGKLVATGQLTHNGPPDVRGNHVTIRLGAYAALPTDQENLADTPEVWSSTKKFWASRGRPRVIKLTDTDDAVYPKLQQHFRQITHLKVELEYQRDR